MMASDRPGDRVSLTRLLWIGPLTIGAAVLANVLFAMVVPPVLGVPPDFPALTKEAVGMFTAVGVFLAVVVFAIVARFARRPISLYRRIALVALGLSFIPDLALLVLPGPVPVTIREALLLMTTHVIAASIAIGFLTGLSGQSTSMRASEA